MLTIRFLLFTLGLAVLLVNAAPTSFDQSADELVARGKVGKIVKKIDKKLFPPKDKALFWSGNINGKVAIKTAEKLAKKTGKQTLEMGLKKEKIKIPLDGKKKTAKLWDHASKTWAQRSKGKTGALLGDVRKKSDYNVIEKPALLKNKKVTKLTEFHVTKKGASKAKAKAKGSSKVDVKRAPKSVRKGTTASSSSKKSSKTVAGKTGKSKKSGMVKAPTSKSKIPSKKAKAPSAKAKAKSSSVKVNSSSKKVAPKTSSKKQAQKSAPKGSSQSKRK